MTSKSTFEVQIFIITKVLDKPNCLEWFLVKSSLVNRYYLQHSFCLVDFIIELKKDLIRLSMTTDTAVDCLNIITIRLSIVFGDCM